LLISNLTANWGCVLSATSLSITSECRAAGSSSYEIKSRRGTGPIEFEWSRREEEACRRAMDVPRDQHWPLAAYRVLVVSQLVVLNKTPEVIVLEAADCLEGAEATGWVVRSGAGVSIAVPGQALRTARKLDRRRPSGTIVS
jgi:hypothetical protein